MKSLYVLALVTLSLVIPSAVLNIAVMKNSSPISTQLLSKQVDETVVKLPEPSLENNDPIKTYPIKKILTLEARNMVVLRGPVTQDSVSETMKKLKDVSARVSVNTPIYLILDTPGGSVFDGLDFIDFANALPQKIHTVTLFAASMGFHIAQSLDERFIARNGTLMSHRATLGGLSGQLDGELETRYKMIKRSVDYLDTVAAKRLKMDVKDYKSMIVNEYWVHGFDAVDKKVADEQVLLRCGSSLDGTETITYRTFFGPVDVTFSKCPLIKAPLKIDFQKLFGGIDGKDKETEEAINMVFSNQRKFVQKYITTDRFYEIFP